MIGAKTLCIRFDKVHEFIRVYEKSRYFVLFAGEKYDLIYNRIRYPVGEKSRIANVISNNYANIKVDSFDSLLLEKTLTFVNVIIHIKLVGIKIKTTTTTIYS